MSSRSTPEKKIVLDSSAWIEYAKGTTRGQKVSEEMKGAQIYMSSFNLLEICSEALRRGIDEELVFRAVLQKTVQYHVDAESAINAARMHSVAKRTKPKFAHGDALAFVTADELGATLITCDSDFRGMKNVIVVS